MNTCKGLYGEGWCLYKNYFKLSREHGLIWKTSNHNLRNILKFNEVEI